MSISNDPSRGLLMNLLAGLGSGAVQVIKLDLASGQDINEQIKAASEKLDAEHRETCPTCAALYEQAQARAKLSEAVDPRKENLKARHDAERAALARQHDLERENSGLYDEPTKEQRFEGVRPEMAAPYGDSQSEGLAKPVFHEIGFMAFDGKTPLPGSFSADPTELKQGIELYRADPMVKALKSLFPGMPKEDLTIQRVYVKRDE